MQKKIIPFFFFIYLVTFFIYIQGLGGGFLFDDFPNLKDMGTYGDIDSWDKVRAFVQGGIAGPTGRPISLLSFLIDDNTWPSIPLGFKYTNIMIHMLNGILLFWASLLLLRSYQYKEKQAIWIALISSSIWLLHPYFVSTTLYVVQRMAQLALLFSLVGIIGYLKGRLLLSTKKISAYIWMTISIGIGTILATYSKENGALLPLLILVIEFCNPVKENKPIWQWRAICLWLPSIAILVLLAKYMTFAENPWPNRNFNMIERLYSETRIVSEYLYNLIIPQIELAGLYQDGFIVSRSLLQPLTTLYSLIFLLSLLVFSFSIRMKFPLLALAIIFFFAAHIMESTVLGLELYFEHRNYAASIFLFLPIASGLYSLKSRIDPKLVNLIVILIFLFLGFFTYKRVELWSDTDRLQVYWAKNSPNSVRAQNAISTILYEHGRIDESNQYLKAAIEKFPDSTLLSLQLVLQKVYSRSATEQDFINVISQIKSQSFDGQAVNALRTLVEYIVDNDLGRVYGSNVLNVIFAMESNEKYNSNYDFRKLITYLKAKIYLAQSKPDLALEQYLVTISMYRDVEAGMMMVAELGSAGYTKQALILLEKVKVVYQHQTKLQRTKREYDFEVQRVEELLKQQLQSEEVTAPNTPAEIVLKSHSL